MLMDPEPLLEPPALPDVLPVEPPVPVAPVLDDPDPPLLEPPLLDPPDADEPEPLPIVAFARMKSPPDEEELLPDPLDALLDAPDPLPDCRHPVNVMFWLPPLRVLLLPEVVPV